MSFGVGNTFVYLVTGPLVGQSATETDHVVSSDDSGHIVMDVMRTDNKHYQDSYLNNGTQLLYTGSTDLIHQTNTTCLPPLIRLQTPLLSGQTVSSTTTCTTRTQSGTFLGSIQQTDAFTPTDLVGSVTVPAGTFSNVLRLVFTSTVNETHVVYIAPGVAIIRIVVTFGANTQTFDLTGGTVGGQPIGQ